MEIVSVDNVTGGEEEFVVMDWIKINERNDWDRNDMKDSFLYGFVTTGEDWIMYRYDGTSFMVAGKVRALFETMGKNKKRWIDNHSTVVDCLYSAMSDGGIERKDVVMG
ncbi:hypothetical protein BGX38DRAFT_1330453 [Terfezia claveryi]|nr:hypothetical protein BGX38DRAFT_1330453 [Terfezia claveryi]